MNSLTTTLPLLDEIRAALAPDLPVYLVGGAVRDLLLGGNPHDLDFVLPENALAVSRRLANTLGAVFYPLDEERDTGRVILTTQEGQRFTLDFSAFRAADLEGDLRGRDFTLNAMAIDLRQPEALIDPMGGAQDLHSDVLRACSRDSLSDDPVRILRCVRLAVHYEFRIAPDTHGLIQQALPRLPEVSMERMRDELFRILEDPKAVTALRILDRLGALDAILPELADLKDVDQSPPHNYDVWTHTLHTAQRLYDILGVLGLEHDPESAANWTMGLVSLRLGRYRKQLDEHLKATLNPERPLRAILLLAALYHDIGKPRTRKVDEDWRIHYFDHERLGVEIVRERAMHLRLSNLEVDRLSSIVRNHMRPLMLAQGDQPTTHHAIYRFFRDTGESGVDVCLLALADNLATYGPSLPQETWTRQLDVVRVLLEAWWEHPEERVSPPPLISGYDLMEALKLKPGPRIGVLLEAIREGQATGEVKSREQALEFARSYKP